MPNTFCGSEELEKLSKEFDEWQQSLKINETVWGPWERKFAWTKTIVSDTPVWLKFYYRRTGRYTPRYQDHTFYHTFYEDALDLFDILKKGY